MNDALHTLGNRELVVPFALAALATAAALGVALSRRREPRLDSFGGFIAISIALAAIWRTGFLGDAGPWLVAAALLSTAGAARGRRASTLTRGAVWCIPGALLFARASMEADAPSAATWTAAGILLFACTPIVLGDTQWRGTGLGPALVALAAAGVFLCVPDTEQAMPIFGAAAGVAVIALAMGSPRLGASGAGLVALVLWAAIVGGAGRPGSIAGALASVVLVALEPIVRARTRTVGGRQGRVGAWIVLGVEGVGVFLASRVAGLEQSALVAAIIALPVTLALVGALAVIGARPEKRAGRP